MRPEQFLSIAEDLFNNDDYDCEAGYRTVIGRVYYGIMHYISRRMGYIFQNKEHFHSRMVQMLQETDRTLSNFFANLKDLREHADYRLNQELVKLDVEQAFSLKVRIEEYLEH